jgi:glycosyltransferase involved in cell wall biosynthesis
MSNIRWFSWKDVRHPAAGGAERLGHEWRQRLVSDGHAVQHVTARYQGSSPSEIIDGVETIRCGRSSLTHYPAAAAFHARRSRDWPDYIVEEVNTVPYFVDLLRGSDRVTLLYYQLARRIWFYQTYLPVAAAGYVAEGIYTYAQGRRHVPVITISDDSRRDLASFGVPSGVTIVRVGIDNTPLASYVAAAKTIPFTVLFHGSLRAMKRPIDALRAFNGFVAAGGRGQLWVSGGGDDASLRRYVDSNGLGKMVTFFGRTSEAQKLDLMTRASVVVATSVKEGWGLVVTEANSMATPAIVYDVDGLRSAAGPYNWTVSANPQALATRLLDASRTFAEPARYDDWCRQVLNDSRQYTLDASYQDFRAALFRNAGSTGPGLQPGQESVAAGGSTGRALLVSVCVGVRNGIATADRFVQAVREQTYRPIELIVVDNFSSDGTAEFYRERADLFLQQGPERSAQRNLAIERARGAIVVVLDADQYLSAQVIEECVTLMTGGAHGVFIPEETVAQGFWGSCKKFERDFYLRGDMSAEAARCFWRDEVVSIGSYDERQTGSEDWDLSDRMLARFGNFARTRARIVHDEGHIELVSLLKKKRYYAERGISDYLRVAPAYRRLPFPLRPSVRRQWWRFVLHPVLAGGALTMKLLEGLVSMRRRPGSGE